MEVVGENNTPWQAGNPRSMCQYFPNNHMATPPRLTSLAPHPFRAPPPPHLIWAQCRLDPKSGVQGPYQVQSSWWGRGLKSGREKGFSEVDRGLVRKSQSHAWLPCCQIKIVVRASSGSRSDRKLKLSSLMYQKLLDLNVPLTNMCHGNRDLKSSAISKQQSSSREYALEETIHHIPNHMRKKQM